MAKSKSLKYGLLIWIVLLCIASSRAWAEEDEIKIGIIGMMELSVGQEQWNGAKMAADEINRAGGIKMDNKRLKIKLIKADSNEVFSVASATDAMERLILKDKCFAVIGGMTSEGTLAMQDVAMDHKTLFISACAAHAELCNRVAENYERYKYYFRGGPMSNFNLTRGILSQIRSVMAMMKDKLGIDHFKVAILAEKNIWCDPMVEQAEIMLPKMGVELVGTWRPRMTARDLTTELKAIEATNCHIILSMINGPAGIPLGRQYGELKIPAVLMGIITPAMSLKFYKNTQGMGDYVTTFALYTRGLEINELTKPFVEDYYKRYKEVPAFFSVTHTIIRDFIKPALEATGSLDRDKLIHHVENHVAKFPGGVIGLARDEMGRPTHDISWGPKYVTGIAAQWQEGKLVPVWPHFKWSSPYWQFTAEAPATPNELSYKGLKSFKIAPWILSVYKK